MDLSILEQFGLRRNDIKVYNSLLKLGKSKTGLIAKQSRVVSSRVYESLNNLIDNGLVSYEVRNNIRYYQAELPDQFIEEIDKSRDKLKKYHRRLKNSQSYITREMRLIIMKESMVISKQSLSILSRHVQEICLVLLVIVPILQIKRS